jgi:hypothetical protein
MISLGFMGGNIAGLPKRVEDIRRLPRQDTIIRKTPKGLLKRLPIITIDRMVRRDQLG